MTPTLRVRDEIGSKGVGGVRRRIHRQKEKQTFEDLRRVSTVISEILLNG